MTNRHFEPIPIETVEITTGEVPNFSTILLQEVDDYDADVLLRSTPGFVGPKQRLVMLNKTQLASAGSAFASYHADFMPQVDDATSKMTITQHDGWLQCAHWFPDLDSITFSLYQDWLGGDKLHGPEDFHPLTHYLILYTFAAQHNIEVLRNLSMDLVRLYYSQEDFTAPAFRLRFIYSHTAESDPMRWFLVFTAAMRAINSRKDGNTNGINPCIRRYLTERGDFATEYCAALLYLANKPGTDVREGSMCKWHVHTFTAACS